MQVVQRPCDFRGKCTTLTEIENPMDLESLSMYQTKWCNKHEKQYKREQNILDKLVPKYNKMNLVTTFGRPIKFTHGFEISNYLFTHGKKRELNKILKRAVKK